MNKPTPAQIEKEIKELKEIKPKVRHFSLFKDDNRKAVGVQIEVLTHNLTEDQIENRWGGLCDEDNSASLSLYENATEARRWLDGESEEGEESLVENWHPLIE
jgi:hypothetical protein